MLDETITRAAATPGYALCRCFCRHFVTLTGTGLAAAGRPAGDLQTEGGDND
jgi:hypothetical protein